MIRVIFISFLIIVGVISTAAAVIETRCGLLHYPQVCFSSNVFIIWCLAFSSLLIAFFLLMKSKIENEREKYLKNYNLYEFGEKDFDPHLSMGFIDTNDFMFPIKIDTPNDA